MTKSDRSYLIVTGSSAGGIETLSRLLATLPADFPAAIVLAQHLDPRVPSSLAVILSKRTTLAVLPVEDSVALRPATVYVVPADRHVEITDGAVFVHADGAHGRAKPSIDLLFSSAAAVFGERLIAVVLSGLGSDGTEGARAVKRHGGTVIIEDPLTATFPSMPASLEPSMVDAILPVDRIGAELVRLINESIDMPDDLPELTTLLERVRVASGIDFSNYKPPTIKRRLARQIAGSGCKSIAEYLAFLDRDPTEFGRLVGNFLIKVTQFFRDGPAFDALRDTIVPAIVDEARRRGGREIRLWSAGCATGEEAYSLAILVAEAVREEREFFNVRVFATDIDEAAISYARRGVYPRDSVAHLAPELVERYFVRVNDGYEVGKAIRAMTVFGVHDLAQRAPFPRIDLALCRNVLIYFSKTLQQRTLQIFAFSLRLGGFLMLGKAESTSPLADFFTPVDVALRLFRRYGDRVTISAPSAPKALATARGGDGTSRTFPAFEPMGREDRVTVNEKLGAFLTGSSIGVVLVDRNYDIIAINASARVMFGIHGLAIGDDLVHLMSVEVAGAVRALLDKALRNEQPKAGGEEIAVRVDDALDERFITLSCYPDIDETTQLVKAAVILAVDVTELAVARQAADTKLDVQSRELSQLRTAEKYARDRQRSLIEANKQLAAVNSELRAQNDMLVINAEESEAATEEIETLNEEMQATNEELETLNEEFQATIEELNTSNDEHETRGVELQAQLTARAQDGRRAESAVTALTSIVDDFASAIAAVDVHGAIVVANERFRTIQNRAADSSVSIEDDAGATISLSVLLRRAGEGEGFGFVYRSIAADQTTSVYHGRARPQTSAGPVRSIVELDSA